MDNILPIAAATAAQFAIGMAWYGGIFGKFWAKAHGLDKLSKKELDKMNSEMGPTYGLQLLMNVLAATALTNLILLVPDYSIVLLVLIVWSGFTIPAQFAAIAFGNDDRAVQPKKLFVMMSGSLVTIMAAGFILKALIV